MAFRYSVACPTLAWTGYDALAEPEPVLRALAGAGYNGVDLLVEGTDAEVMRPLLSSVGLQVPEIMGQWGYVHSGEERDLTSGDPGVRQRGIDYARTGIDLAAELEAPYFNVCAAQPPVPEVPFPRAPISTLRQNFADSLERICDHAARGNVTVLLEPLNLYEAIPGVLTSVFEAIGLIDELGLSNLGIQPDVFHMNISERSIVEALRAAGSRTRVVHMNETNHFQLGTGHADYREIMGALRECAPDACIAVYGPQMSQEVFQQQGRAADRPDLETVMGEQLQFLKEIETAIDAPSSE